MNLKWQIVQLLFLEKLTSAYMHFSGKLDEKGKFRDLGCRGSLDIVLTACPLLFCFFNRVFTTVLFLSTVILFGNYK